MTGAYISIDFESLDTPTRIKIYTSIYLPTYLLTYLRIYASIHAREPANVRETTRAYRLCA